MCTSRLGSDKMFSDLEPQPIIQCLLHLKCGHANWSTVDLFLEKTQAKITPLEILELILKQDGTPKYPIKEVLPRYEVMPEEATPEFRTELLRQLKINIKQRKALACHQLFK